MIRMTVLYPRTDGARFDWTYYLETHVPLVARLLGDAMRSLSVEQGVCGGGPEEPAAFVAIAHLTFDSEDAYLAAFGPHAETIVADLANFTSIVPIVQLGALRVGA